MCQFVYYKLEITKVCHAKLYMKSYTSSFAKFNWQPTCKSQVMWVRGLEEANKFCLELYLYLLIHPFKTLLYLPNLSFNKTKMFFCTFLVNFLFSNVMIMLLMFRIVLFDTATPVCKCQILIIKICNFVIESYLLSILSRHMEFFVTTTWLTPFQKKILLKSVIFQQKLQFFSQT